MNNIRISQDDYKILRELYESADEKTKHKLLQLSIWNTADVAESEVIFHKIMVCGDRAQCYFTCRGPSTIFNVMHRQAVAGDIVYIVVGGPSSSALSTDYVGRCFIVHEHCIQENGVGYITIKAKDTYADGHTYFITIFDNQYLVFKEE